MPTPNLFRDGNSDAPLPRRHHDRSGNPMCAQKRSTAAILLASVTWPTCFTTSVAFRVTMRLVRIQLGAGSVPAAMSIAVIGMPCSIWGRDVTGSAIKASTGLRLVADRSVNGNGTSSRSPRSHIVPDFILGVVPHRLKPGRLRLHQISPFGARGANSGLDFAVRADAKTFSLFSAQSPVGVKGYFAKPGINVVSPQLLSRAGAGIALGLVASPLASILAFVDVGDAKSAQCGPVLAGATAQAQRTTKGKPRDDVGKGTPSKK
eukprot:gene34041-45628_t